MTLADKDTHTLLELSYEDLPNHMDDVIFKLQLRGIAPVLAHFERYAYVRNRYRILDRWVQRAYLAQVNIVSLDRSVCDDVVHGLMNRGLMACTATDASDSVKQPRIILHHSFADVGLSWK